MIEAAGLSKRYGSTVAVDDLSFIVPPGQVTGFLGPNGAGKSTTMRLILGLDAATCGAVTVNGRPYTAHRRPLFEVGALLEAKAFQGGRSAYSHLLCLARSNGISRGRVSEVLDLVGLGRAGGKRAGGFSLGMGQRLGIAAALLAAKTAVFGTAALAAGLATCFGAYLIFQAFLPAGDAMRTSLGDPGVARAVTGAGLYLAVLGLLGLGLGAVLRSGAGAISALFGLLFVPPLIMTLLPTSWQDTAGRYLPMNAAESVYVVHRQAHSLAPWAGFAVFCAYAAAALLAGFIVMSRRDA
jgi:ABC-type branched-subunit amino acid transport system ATPase component